VPGYDDEFRQLRTAKAWGLTPAQWRMQSVDDRALMTAFDGFEALTEAYKSEWREEKRNRGGGKDTFSAMKRKMGLRG